MLNMPLATTTAPSTDTAPMRTSATRAKSESGFSDVFSDMTDRPDDTARQTAARQPAAQTEEESVEPDDTATDAAMLESDHDADLSTEDTDLELEFAAIEPKSDKSEKHQPAQAPEKVLVRGSSENAAMMKLAEQQVPTTKEAVTAASNEAVPTKPEPTVPSATPAQTLQAAASNDALRQVATQSQFQRATDAQPAATPASERMILQGNGTLEAMQVTARSLPQTPAATQPLPDVAAGVQQSATSAGSSLQTSGAEPEIATQKPQVAPDGAAPQQWQARASVEQFNSAAPALAGQASNAPVVESAAQLITTAVDPTLASLEELAPRQMASAQEIASQAKLAQPTQTPAQIVRQLSEAARTSDDKMIELTMDPPELGRVRMTLSEVGGLMTVNISAENQATTELMRRHIDMLRKDFQELGHQDVAFSFEQGNREGQKNNQSEWSATNGALTADNAAETTDETTLAGPPQQMSASTGIDIRV